MTAVTHLRQDHAASAAVLKVDKAGAATVEELADQAARSEKRDHHVVVVAEEVFKPISRPPVAGPSS